MPNTNPGFTLAEDAAMKKRLSAIAVSDDKEPTRVADVFFRYPEGEKEKTYPFITIDLVDIAYAAERQESEKTYYYATEDSGLSDLANIDYYPSELNPTTLAVDAPADSYLHTDQFVPVNLIYQVTTYARSQRHDRQITATLLRRVFPLRRGFIEIPEDGTIRRCDLLDWRTNDVLDQETGYKKRIFRKVFTVSVNAEIPQSDFEVVQQVLEVNGTLNAHNQVLDNPSLTEDF